VALVRERTIPTEHIYITAAIKKFPGMFVCMENRIHIAYR